MKKAIFAALMLFASANLLAEPCTAIRNDDWDKTTTWSCGRVPTCGDSVVIAAGITVTIDDQADYTACGSPIKINIFGVLAFVSGKKLLLPCGSYIWVQEGGRITSGGGGGSSNTIEICTVVVWKTSDGDVSGYKTLPTEVMPIELTSFYAVPDHNAIVIRWESATESNNKEYTVERSGDGVIFTILEVIPSKADRGNSVKPLNYEFTDKEPVAGTAFYRLKQTDYNGKFEYFQIISVDFEKSKHITFTVYPNPNQGQFTVDFSGIENNHEIEVVMHDQNGRLVYQRNVLSESLATNTFSIAPDSKIAPGLYMVNFIVEGVKYPVKVIVQ